MTVDIGNNLITNPSLKSSTSGWVKVNGSVAKTSSGGRFTISSGASATIAAAHRFTAKAGYKYALSGVQYKKNTSTASLFMVRINWYNSSGSLISSSANNIMPAATVGVWNTMPRYEVTAPAGAVKGSFYVGQSTSSQSMDYTATNFVLKRAVVPPTVNAGVDQSKVQGESASLTAVATAGDGSITKYLWSLTAYSGTPEDRPNLSSTSTASTVVGPVSVVGFISAQVTVTDSLGVTATDYVDINVGAGPAPVVDAGPFQTVYVGGSATLNGTESSTAGIASRLWTATGGVAITSPTSASTVVGPFTMAGTYTFTYKATDVNGKAGTDTVAVSVIPVPSSTAINERVRLEVLADDVENQISNHSSQDSSTVGWTPVNATLTASTGNAFGSDGHAFLLTRTANTTGSTYMFGALTPVTPGKWLSATAQVRLTGTAPMRVNAYTAIQWYNGGTYLGQYGTAVVGATTPLLSPDTTYTATTMRDATTKEPAVQVPSGVTHAKVVVSTYSNVAYPPAQYNNVYAWNVQLLQGPTAADVQDIPFNPDGDYWQNILGKSLSVSTSRGAALNGVTDSLDTGLLTAVVVDPDIAPDKSSRVRPGKQVRLRAFNNGSSAWEPVWTGTITESNATYRKRKPVITVTATDAVADLQNIQGPAGYSGAFRQRVDAVLFDAPVLYDTADSDVDSTSIVISVDEQGTALSQLEMARNSLHGIMYVDKMNTLQTFAANSLPTTSPVVTFSDSKSDVGSIQYADIDVNFGSKALINTLSVEKHDAVGEYGQYTYGPYLNDQSVSDWGTQSATLVVNDGDPVTQAGYYLSTFSNPSVFPTSVTFRSDNNLSQSVGLELYQAARVKFADAGLDGVYRIIGIEHDVLPDSWETTVFFRPLEASGSISVTVPAAGGLTGPADLTVYSQGIQRGVETVPASSTAVTSQTVTFAKPYATPPNVLVSLNVTIPTNRSATATNITTTGFTIYLKSTSSTSLPVTWVALPATSI